MTKAQVLSAFGPPDVMEWQDWDVPPPTRGEVRMRHTAIGINFADAYHRGGVPHPWPVPEPPCVIGFEAAGIVEDVGPGVENFTAGDRVAYGIPPLGSYAEIRNYPADKLLHLPHALEDKQVAALLMKGMTAQYLLRRTYEVQPGDTILVHAAAGGMGLILCSWANHLGATVVGTVSTPEKAEIARAAGCHYPVVRKNQDFAQVCRDVTDGEGVAVVYEAIGRTRCRNRSIVSGRWACALLMATCRDRRTRSISSPISARGVRCSSRVPPSCIMWRSGRTSMLPPTSCST
jgi:NADPH:quinone reductase-like Zn-dependent oxidoreductase